MRRRITLAILITVATTLVLAGLGTVVLARIGARRATETQLRDEVETVAALLDGERIDASTSSALADGPFTVVTLRGPTIVSGTLPDGVTVRDLDLAALRDGQTASGPVGNRYFAAHAVASSNDGTRVLVAARPIDPVGGAMPWFLISSGIALLLAVVVGDLVSRRLVAPVREVTTVTARIAGGDLAARLPERGPTGPHDEIADLAHSVNAMADALERSRGLERQFVLSVSHDLRTPLTSIRGYAEAIADDAVPDARAAADIILSESRRLERLVVDLLDLGMLDARQFTFHWHDVDLRELTEDAVDGFRHRLQLDGVTIELRTGNTPMWVRVDPDRLQQAIANLIENAAKYARTSIALTVAAVGGWAQVSIVDDGPGIADDALGLVFERSYTGSARATRDHGIGSGLGLAIVRELLLAMHGSVAAHNDPTTGGAQLVISLPLVPGPAQAPASPSR